jgi:hypothetical protein
MGFLFLGFFAACGWVLGKPYVQTIYQDIQKK